LFGLIKSLPIPSLDGIELRAPELVGS
jgi:hypothetical protein